MTSLPSICISNDADFTADFPYIVIEYFKEDLEVRPGDKILRMKGDSSSRVDLEEYYDIKQQKFKAASIILHSDDNRVYTERWKYIGTIVVIQPSPTQTYFSESLDHPHYSVHPIEYQSFQSHVKAFQRTNGGLPKLKFCNNTINHSIPGMVTITNQMTSEVREVMDGFDLNDIVSYMNKNKSKDPRRRNIKVDSGLTSGQCQIRKEKWSGISGPNILKTTHDPPVRRMREQLYRLLDCGVPQEWRGRVYNDQERQHYFEVDGFPNTHPGVQIHASRASLGSPYSCLAIHRDVHNDNEDENFAPVLVVSWLVSVDSKATRVALITYSRKFVGETMAKIAKYSPAIEFVSSFYFQMQVEGRANIDQEIFKHKFVTGGNTLLVAARVKPYMDTCVHYSAMGADALLKLNRKYRISMQQGLALLYSVCASNSPDYFRVFTNHLLQDEDFANKYFETKNPLMIAIDVYEMIFSRKAESSRNKQKLLGQRHQPCGNRQASRQAIRDSLQTLVSLCSSFANWSKTKKSLGCKQHVREMYFSTLKTLCKSETNGGVYGAGPLIANKLLHTGALVGLFPFQFLLQSKIAESTNTFYFFDEVYDLSNPDEDSPILLDGIAHLTKTNPRMAEGSCCKAAIEWSQDTYGKGFKATDTIYPDMSILTVHYEVDGKLKRLIIKETTAQSTTVVAPEDLCWVWGDSLKITPWVNCDGLWIGSFDRPRGERATVPGQVPNDKKKQQDFKRARVKGPEKKGGVSKKKPAMRAKKWLNQVNMVGSTVAYKGKKGSSPPSVVYAPSIPKRGKKKRKRAALDKGPAEFEWVSFNYPVQADVILATLNCRKPFNKWALLARALGGGTNKSASKRLVDLKWTKGGMVVPSITDATGSIYYPPVPGRSWKKSKLLVSEEGRVSFPNARVAQGYTVMNFLMDRYRKGMEDYFSEILAAHKWEFVPQTYKVGSRMCDPIKMIVFYDSDKQSQVEMMAVCLLLRKKQGVFALVDDFGRVMEDTTTRFVVQHPVFRSIV
jgi:hypothetical protein